MSNTFELAHVGINNDNAEKAAELAQLLAMMFNLETRAGQKSEFAGSYFECVRTQYLGTNGHIGMKTDDLPSAVEELKEKGFTFNTDTSPTSPTAGCRTSTSTASSGASPSTSCRSSALPRWPRSVSDRGLRRPAGRGRPGLS